MEDEIDLRQYMAVLLRFKWAILGLAAAAALVAGALSSILPPTYRATTIVSASLSILSSDRVDVVATNPNVDLLASVVPRYAMSDSVLEATVAAVGPTLPANLAGPAGLRPRLQIAQDPKASVFKMTAEDDDPERAAAIANAWADSLVARVAEAFADYWSPSLQAQLRAQLSLLSELRSSQYEVAWAIEDAEALRAQLAKRDPGEPAWPEDQARLLALMTWVSNPVATTWVSDPMALPPALVDISQAPTVGDLLERLAGVMALLDARRQMLDARAADLQTDVFEAQSRLARGEVSPLVALPVIVQILQRADVPSPPAGANALQNAAIAGVIGALLGILLAFGVEWWASRHRPVREPAAERMASA